MVDSHHRFAKASMAYDYAPALSAKITVQLTLQWSRAVGYDYFVGVHEAVSCPGLFTYTTAARGFRGGGAASQDLPALHRV